MAKLINKLFNSTTSEMQGFFVRLNVSFFITDHYGDIKTNMSELEQITVMQDKTYTLHQLFLSLF